MSDLHAHLEFVDQIIGLLQLSTEQPDNQHLTFAIMVLVKEKIDIACVGVAQAIEIVSVDAMRDADLIIKQYLELTRL